MESILNASTFFTYCYELGSSAGTSLIRHLKETDFNNCITDLYMAIEKIENPFIKCSFIRNTLFDTYNSEYDYQNIHHPSGKTDIADWFNFIETYCRDIATYERTNYPKILRHMINHSHLQPLESDFANTIRAYNNFFSSSGIYSKSKSRRRGKNYHQILDILSYEVEPSNIRVLKNIAYALNIHVHSNNSLR
jgi:hypothetical protein